MRRSLKQDLELKDFACLLDPHPFKPSTVSNLVDPFRRLTICHSRPANRTGTRTHGLARHNGMLTAEQITMVSSTSTVNAQRSKAPRFNWRQYTLT